MTLARRTASFVVVAALAAWSGILVGASKTDAQEVLRFRGVNKKVVFNGGHAGDSYTFHTALFRNGEKVGNQCSFGATTERSGSGGQNMFTASAQVPGGRIMWVAKFHFVETNQTFTGAITGGTGQYQGAEGHVTAEQKSSKVTIFTFHIN